MDDQGRGRAGATPLSGLTAEMAQLIGRYDHVTRLPNRLQFLDDFPRLAARPATLTMVTLAGAQHYNGILRALGHAFADGFVQAGAATLGQVVPSRTQIYHVSVLSFAFVAPAVAENEGAAFVDRIVTQFVSSLRVEDIPIKTEVGVGLTALSASDDPAEVLRAALTAAQDSRRSARGWAWYDHRTDAAHRRAFQLLSDLPDAIASGDQLVLHFQPRLALATGRCIGAEALLRWTHPTLGPVSPAEFIPLAEQTALIGPLTDWVLAAAIGEAGRLQREGHGLRISINASPANLSQPGFDAQLLGLCRDLRVDHEHIEIEFTEGTIAANIERATAQLQRLRAAGIEVAIDDFGSGFANLNYLTRIPADVLKIDQSFVRPLDQPDNNPFLIRQIIEMARGLDFRVCAEGIETAQTRERLRVLGCDEGQGYHIARPMPPAQLRDWLSAQG